MRPLPIPSYPFLVFLASNGRWKIQSLHCSHHQQVRQWGLMYELKLRQTRVLLIHESSFPGSDDPPLATWRITALPEGTVSMLGRVRWSWERKVTSVVKGDVEETEPSGNTLWESRWESGCRNVAIYEVAQCLTAVPSAEKVQLAPSANLCQPAWRRDAGLALNVRDVVTDRALPLTSEGRAARRTNCRAVHDCTWYVQMR